MEAKDSVRLKRAMELLEQAAQEANACLVGSAEEHARQAADLLASMFRTKAETPRS